MTVMDKGFLERLEKAKRESVNQLLFKCARLMNELGISRFREQLGNTRFRTAHTLLFPHIDFEGVRLTELAKKVDVSKQAVGQLVNELESYGVVERVPDPSDGRARLIRFSEEGRKALLDGLKVLGVLEEEFTAIIGKRRMKALHDGLSALHAALTEDSVS